MSDPDGDAAARSLADRALDLLVFAPAGAVLTAIDDIPAMAAKGRGRIERELHNAHVIGRFAVVVGRRQLQSHLGTIFGGANASTGAEPPVDATTPSENARPSDGPASAVAAPRVPHVPPPASAARNPEVDSAIADYDSLSASQVVRRLDGLGVDELAAVERHELTTRGRRTIVSRARQLIDERADPDAAH